jgi:hypothetical protein
METQFALIKSRIEMLRSKLQLQLEIIRYQIEQDLGLSEGEFCAEHTARFRITTSALDYNDVDIFVWADVNVVNKLILYKNIDIIDQFEMLGRSRDDVEKFCKTQKNIIYQEESHEVQSYDLPSLLNCINELTKKLINHKLIINEGMR